MAKEPNYSPQGFALAAHAIESMAGRKPLLKNKLDQLLVLLVIWPPLIPSMQAGTSIIELASFLIPCASALLLFLRSRQSREPQVPVWTVAILWLSAHLSLQHETVQYFLTLGAGFYAFSLSVAVGATSDERRGALVMNTLFLQLFALAALEVLLDVTGWRQAGTRELAAWELGNRGLNAARSLSGMFLCAIALWMIVHSPKRVYRTIAAPALVLGLVHVAVIGQGRGTTLTALGGMALLATRSRKLLIGILLLGIPLIALLDVDAMQPYLGPLANRFEAQSLSELDRVDHVRNSIRLMVNMDLVEALTGINQNKVRAGNGDAIHNALFDIFVNYGLIAGVAFVALCTSLGLVAGLRLINPRSDARQNLWSVLTIMFLTAGLSSPVFVNWRSCILPGIAAGFCFSRNRLNES